MTRRGDTVDQLRRWMSRRERAARPVLTARVVGRRPDGLEELEPVDGGCVRLGGRGGGRGGELRLTPSNPDPSRAGFGSTPASGSSLRIEPPADTTVVDMPEITAVSPRELARDATHLVTLTGRGFRRYRLHAEFLRSAERRHLGVLLDGVVDVQDDTTATATVRVAADADRVRDAPLAYGTQRPISSVPDRRLPLTLENAYSVVDAAVGGADGPAAYLGVVAADSTLRAWTYNAAGALMAEVGAASASSWHAARSAPVLDGGALVGAHSVLWVAASGSRVYLADLAGGVVHQASATAGRIAGAVWRSGRVWWLEWTPGSAPTCALRLVSANAVLGDIRPERSGALEALDGAGPYTWDTVVSGVGFGSEAACLIVDWVDAFSATGASLGVLPYLVDEVESSDGAGVGAGSALGLPRSVGGAVDGVHLWDGTAGGEGGDGWTRWAPPGYGLGDRRGAPVPASGNAALYDPPTGRVVTANVGAPPPTPSELVLESHPDFGWPEVVFPT
ncbi:MAG: hypothetical protein AAGC60_00295 [Acidobacteriota bacterium]